MHYIKHNNTNYDEALLIEADGLKTLRDLVINSDIDINIPNVFDVNENVLVLDLIQQQSPIQKHWHNFGLALAELHMIEHNYYGLNYNNFIGLNPQPNQASKQWGEFFFYQRLMYQIEQIKESSVKIKFSESLTQLAKALIDFLNKNCNHPSLLHGDLWSGNVLFDKKGVWLIDPAIYYGDADADIAMTELFGGFSTEFYEPYFSAKPKSINYELKRTIYNLYHQLNHYNLFGSIYLEGCKSAFRIIKNQFI